ncbi:hypothetical protein LCGC14_1790970, partial [marine sediment metagenome]
MTNCRPLLNNYKVHSFDFTKETYFGIAYETLCGKMGLFGDDGDDEDQQQSATANLPDVPEWDERDKLTKEKEVLGFYLSSHP